MALTPGGVRSITEQQQSLFDYMSKGSSVPRQEAQEKDPEQQLEELKKNCLSCKLCILRNGCRQVVFGDGNPRARLMLIGEGPGADEDRIGIPFVGRAGRLLDRILSAVKIERKEVYIANVIKCRPPGNRLPFQSEIDHCLPHLEKQIELINPQIVVCLGALSMRTLIDKNASITRSRGRWHEIGGRRFMATFHPAALLRDPGKKRDVWEDFIEIVKYYHDDGGCG